MRATKLLWLKENSRRPIDCHSNNIKTAEYVTIGIVFPVTLGSSVFKIITPTSNPGIKYRKFTGKTESLIKAIK